MKERLELMQKIYETQLELIEVYNQLLNYKKNE